MLQSLLHSISCCAGCVFAPHLSLARPHKSQSSAQWTPAKAWLSSQMNFDPRDSSLETPGPGSWFMVHCPHSAPTRGQHRERRVHQEISIHTPYLIHFIYQLNGCMKTKENENLVSFVRMS